MRGLPDEGTAAATSHATGTAHKSASPLAKHNGAQHPWDTMGRVWKAQRVPCPPPPPLVPLQVMARLTPHAIAATTDLRSFYASQVAAALDPLVAGLCTDIRTALPGLLSATPHRLSPSAVAVTPDVLNSLDAAARDLLRRGWSTLTAPLPAQLWGRLMPAGGAPNAFDIAHRDQTTQLLREGEAAARRGIARARTRLHVATTTGLSLLATTGPALAAAFPPTVAADALAYGVDRELQRSAHDAMGEALAEAALLNSELFAGAADFVDAVTFDDGGDVPPFEAVLALWETQLEAPVLRQRMMGAIPEGAAVDTLRSDLLQVLNATFRQPQGLAMGIGSALRDLLGVRNRTAPLLRAAFAPGIDAAVRCLSRALRNSTASAAGIADLLATATRDVGSAAPAALADAQLEAVDTLFNTVPGAFAAPESLAALLRDGPALVEQLQAAAGRALAGRADAVLRSLLTSRFRDSAMVEAALGDPLAALLASSGPALLGCAAQLSEAVPAAVGRALTVLEELLSEAVLGALRQSAGLLLRRAEALGAGGFGVASPPASFTEVAGVWGCMRCLGRGGERRPVRHTVRHS